MSSLDQAGYLVLLLAIFGRRFKTGAYRTIIR